MRIDYQVSLSPYVETSYSYITLEAADEAGKPVDNWAARTDYIEKTYTITVERWQDNKADRLHLLKYRQRLQDGIDLVTWNVQRGRTHYNINYLTAVGTPADEVEPRIELAYIHSPVRNLYALSIGISYQHETMILLAVLQPNPPAGFKPIILRQQSFTYDIITPYRAAYLAEAYIEPRSEAFQRIFKESSLRPAETIDLSREAAG